MNKSAALLQFIAFLLVSWLLTGCAAVVRPGSLEQQEPVHLAVSVVPEKLSPQPALRATIRWNASLPDGVGMKTFEFRSIRNGIEIIEQKGPSPFWDWSPRKIGEYRIRLRAWNEENDIVESAWSDTYTITPAIGSGALVAFLPLENLSGVKVPLGKIGANFAEWLRANGMQLLSEQRLKAFMRRHRMRYTGGISSALARALRDEEGVDAVFIVSLESYVEGRSPALALTARLVLCQDFPRIAWIEGVGITGADELGLLNLKKIENIEQLRDLAFGRLFTSLNMYLAGDIEERPEVAGKFRPRQFYRTSSFTGDTPYRVAIVPFLNRYSRKNAGFVVSLHLVNALSKYENLDVVEPGLVREQLLKYRLIMQAGPSLSVADILASKKTLGADLILSGYVFDYQDQSGTPKVDFSTRLFSGPERKIVWWSRSYASGDDGVFFFNFGRIRSTHSMMQQMSLAISDLLFTQ